MKLQNVKGKLHELWKRRSTMVLILTAIIGISLASMDQVNALYILSGATDSAIVLNNTTSVSTIKSLSSKLLYVGGDKANGYEVTLTPGKAVSITYDDAVITTQSQVETISDLLDRLHISPSSKDMILVDLSGSTISLKINSDVTYYDKEVEAVAYETTRVPSAYLSKGTEKVIQEGVNGARTSTYKVTYSNGELVSRERVSQTDSTAVNQVVAYGTTVSSVSADDALVNITNDRDGSGNGTLTFASGATMRFASAKSMTATAYTQGTPGVNNITATGTTVHKGVVAVDPRVIPLGTRLYVRINDGSYIYGYAVAEDTGVRGSVIDLYYDTYNQCIQFGRRACTVYILG